MNIKKIVNFIFELNQLKRQKQTGFQLLGIDNPESVAGHSLRAAQIGYILAYMEEGVNAERVASILIMHDNAETRVGDQHKVAARYFSKKEAEEKAFSDQLDNLGKELKLKWQSYFKEYKKRNTKEGIIAKDADWLETAFQAKEYFDLGYKDAKNWIDNVEKAVETESAKKIVKEMKKVEFTDWWSGLKKMTYKKLK